MGISVAGPEDDRTKKTNKQSDKISEKKLDNKIGPKNLAEKKNTRTKKTDKKSENNIGQKNRTNKRRTKKQKKF